MGALTTALFITYMLVAPLTGWLGDRFPRKPLIIVGAVLWSLATLATAWVHSYSTLYIRHALVGVGEATFGIYCARGASPTSIPSANATGFSPFSMSRFPWARRWATSPEARWARTGDGARRFSSARIPGLVVAALYAWIGREPRARRQRPLRAHGRSRNTVGGLFRNPPFLTATFGLATLTFAMGGISAWMPEFLRRSGGLPLGGASHIVGASTVIDGIAGTLVGGMIAQRLAAHQSPRALSALRSGASPSPCPSAP